MSLALLPGTSPIVLTQRGKKPRAPQLPLAAHEKKKVAYFCRMCAPMSSSFQAFVTHNFVTHSLSHTTFTRTIFDTPLCHTPLRHTLSFTHNFHTHHLSHTTLSHTISLCHTPSFTYNFVTHNSSHTTCFTSRSSTTSFVFPSFPAPLQHLLPVIGRS